MKLFLTSSGISENLRQPFLKNYAKDPRTSKCYFIPTATGLDENKFYTCKSMDDLAQIGFNPIWYSLKYKTKELLARELADADIIWVGGGNTFYLLDVARKTGLLEVVVELVKHNHVAYGGISAGTILASVTIASAGWEPLGDSNDIDLQDLSALGLVDFTSVVHYESSQDDAIQKYKDGSGEVVKIPNGAMVFVNENGKEFIGGAEVFK